MLVVIFKTFLMKIPGGRTFVSASIANTVVDGIERFCGRIFTANSATSGVAAIKSVCSKYGAAKKNRKLYIYCPFLKSISLFSRRFFSENFVLL